MKLQPLNPLVRAAQSIVLEVVVELVRLDQRLFEVVQDVPLPGDLVAMGEDEVPHSVGAQLSGIVNAVRNDLLKDAIATLTVAAQTTEEDLRKEFVEWDFRNLYDDPPDDPMSYIDGALAGCDPEDQRGAP